MSFFYHNKWDQFDKDLARTDLDWVLMVACACMCACVCVPVGFSEWETCSGNGNRMCVFGWLA